MRRLPTFVIALFAVAAPAAAADDPIAVRQALMYNNGSAAGVAGGIMKGELPYSPAVGMAVINAFQATALAVGDFFPEGSADPARSEAAPKIWEDMAGFQAELAKFQANAAKAVEASGRDGPAEATAFQAAVMPIFDNCKACHETYRLEDE